MFQCVSKHDMHACATNVEASKVKVNSMVITPSVTLGLHQLSAKTDTTYTFISVSVCPVNRCLEKVQKANK